MLALPLTPTVDPIYNRSDQVWRESPNRQFRLVILFFLFFDTFSLSFLTHKHLLEARDRFLLCHNQLLLVISFLLKLSDRSLKRVKLKRSNLELVAQVLLRLVAILDLTLSFIQILRAFSKLDTHGLELNKEVSEGRF